MEIKNTHGGKRKHAGPPLKGKEPRVRVNITFDTDDLHKMDTKRQYESRGDFLGKLIKKDCVK